MNIKKILGSIRRNLYNTRDTFLYQKWLEAQPVTVVKKINWQPLISIIVPTYNTDINFFNVMVQSVINQRYENWELILVDDKSPDGTVRDRIQEYAKSDARIKYLFLEQNHHIAGATNEGIKMAKGDFIGLLDHDDVLLEHALLEVVSALNKNNKLEFIYTDEDKIIGSKRTQPFFKPSLNIDLIHSVNYITHFSVIKKTTLDIVGYENTQYNGAQDWELFLRVIRSIPSENIHHIPKVLYSWRVHALSTSKDMGVKPYVLKSQEMAIRDDLAAREVTDYKLAINQKYRGQWQLKYLYKKKPSVIWVGDFNDITKEQIEKYDFVAVTRGLTERKKEIALRLVGEAARKDIAIVITGTKDTARSNIWGLLSEDKVTLLQKFTHISVSKHIYETARYNIPIVYDYDIAILATESLNALPDYIGKDIHDLSFAFEKVGVPHLYIPYQDLL